MVGSNGADDSIIKSYAYNRSGKHVTTGTIKPFDPISFDPVFDYVKLKKGEGKDMRKISAADESAYKIWGGCNSEGATINLTGAVTATTTCGARRNKDPYYSLMYRLLPKSGTFLGL